MIYPTERVIKDIRAERVRQMAILGWTLEHDDEHTDRSLAAAAACYAYQASLHPSRREGTAWQMPGFISIIRMMWPHRWDLKWWNPRHARRDLVKSAALIVAEIERLDRIEEKKNREEGILPESFTKPDGVLPAYKPFSED